MKADSLNVNSIIMSKSGVHISIYVPHPTSELNFKNLIEVALAKCKGQIGQSLSEEKIVELLGPIKSLMNNSKMLAGFNSHMAIFRTSGFLRIVSLPIDVDFSVHVADSFHVKPLLSYINEDYQYLFFGSDGKKGYLYKGTKKSYYLVDEFHYHDDTFFENDAEFRGLTSDARKKRYLFEMNMSWVEQVISRIDKDNDHCIFISANASETKALRKALKYKQIFWKNISSKYAVEKEKATMHLIQKTMEREKAISLSISLSEFTNPDFKNLTRSRISYDINEISMAAKLGHVKKLLIASDAFVFGKLNETSGEVTMHEADMDHTDDDLLDDIAQNVFKSGGEVLVVQKKSMPAGELIVGALKDFSPASGNSFKCGFLSA